MCVSRAAEKTLDYFSDDNDSYSWGKHHHSGKIPEKGPACVRVCTSSFMCVCKHNVFFSLTFPLLKTSAAGCAKDSLQYVSKQISKLISGGFGTVTPPAGDCCPANQQK